jgi:hypothetical protein
MLKAANFIVSTVVIIICQITIISCAFAKDKTFWGKAIDADTKEPIEGAVIVAIWYEERATVAGGDTRLKDVKEVMTDKSGEWSIVGPEGRNYDLLPGLSFLTGIYFTREPIFIIFKPRYCSWPEGFSVDECKGKIKPGKLRDIIEGGNIELGKLIIRKRMTIIRNLPSLGMADEAMKRLPLFKKLVEQEEKDIQR